MPISYQLVYLLNALTTFALGCFVFYRDIKDRVNFLFFLFSLSLSGWVLTLYFYFNDKFISHITLVGRLNFAFIILMSLFLFLFVYYFPVKTLLFSKWTLRLMFFESLVLALISWLTPFVSQMEIGTLGGVRSTVFGSLYAIFAAHFIFYTIGSCVLLVKKFFTVDKSYKSQLIYFTFGLFMALLFGTTTNIVIPFIFNNFSVQNLGSLSSLVLVFFTTYSIIKHKLLNLKIFAAQAFVVLFTLAFLVPIFYAQTLDQLLMDIGLFVFVVSVGLLLINSIQKVYKQKEELNELFHSLEKANIRLQELDKQKTEFLSIAAHQLRTPLSIIKGYVELVKEGAYGKTTQKTNAVLDNVESTNEHLVKLVDEFLNISRIEQGRTKYNFESANICETITSVVGEMTLRAEEKGLSIVWSNCRLPKLVMDAEKVRHVVFNFVDNAIKYSESGKILVKTEDEGDGIALKVKDSGLGFEKNDQANFYQKFYRGDNVKGTNVNGTGLGLYVCRKFIEAHGGKVWAHSEGLGKGSEFGFWLPYKPVIKEVSQAVAQPAS